MIRNVPDPGLGMSVQLANRIRISTGKARWTEEDLDALTDAEKAYKVRHVLRGHAKVVFPEQRVDLLSFRNDLPEGWSVLEDNTPPEKEFAILTRVDDDLFLDEKRITLHTTTQQMQESDIYGDNVLESLAGRNVLSASLLNHLLKNQFMIPDDWIINDRNYYQAIYFWGTKYSRKDAPNEKLIRFMRYMPEGWTEHYNWTGHSHWNASTPAVEIAA